MAIVGCGLYAPERSVDNAYFDRLYGRDVDTFLREKRHIRARRFLADGQTTSDMVTEAATLALAQAGIAATDLDLIVVATDTPDQLSPSTAAVVHRKLGAATRAGTFDLNAACAGFPTALDLAARYLAPDSRLSHVLVAGGYAMSRFLDWGDYKTATLFADGAGAVVVRRSSEAAPRWLASQLYTDSQYHDYMGIFGGGASAPCSPSVVAAKRHLLRFEKKIPVETNVTLWPDLVRALLDRAGRKLEDVQHFFLTQINVESIHGTLDALGCDRALAHTIMDRYGYTGSAAIPMAIADAAAQHRLRRGDLVVVIGSGGGMAMAGLLFEWEYDT
jgi:3-oxoacyl-[acyl-carrier-protein] synthase-3